MQRSHLVRLETRRTYEERVGRDGLKVNYDQKRVVYKLSA